jgi:hypothetical protein
MRPFPVDLLYTKTFWVSLISIACGVALEIAQVHGPSYVLIAQGLISICQRAALVDNDVISSFLKGVKFSESRPKPSNLPLGEVNPN